MLYFAAATLGVDGGIMVTGSHNPPDHNGFKMVIGGKSFFGADIQASRADGRDARPAGPAPAGSKSIACSTITSPVCEGL